MQMITFSKKIKPLIISQAFGVFNDNAFKAVLIFIALNLSFDYGKNLFFMILMSVVYVLPFLIFAAPAGMFADKYDKKTVLLYSKLFEIIIMAAGLILFYFIENLGLYPLVLVLFFMSLQSCFFSPSFYGILPESFNEKELSKANGIIGMYSFIAVIIGFSFGIIIKSIFSENLYLCGLFFVIISIIGFLSAIKITPTFRKDELFEVKETVSIHLISTLRHLIRRKDIIFSILGEGYFFAVGATVQTILLLFGRFTLGISSDIALGFLQLILAVGMAIGCYLGGKLSKGKLQLGLSFYGLIGLIVFLALAGYSPGSEYNFNLFNTSFSIYPLLLVFLVLAGISGGIFLIPLRVCIQCRTDVKERGEIIACSNFIVFLGILLSSIVTFILTAGHNIDGEINKTDMLYRFKYMVLNFTPQELFLIISLISLVLIIIACCLYSEFIEKAMLLIFGSSLYKFDFNCVENIPETGAAVIIANHASFLDGFIIRNSTSRKINVVMYDDFTKNVILEKIFKYFEFIKRPANENFKEYREYCSVIKNKLINGEIVLVFPEKKLTRNGAVGKFYDEISSILPDFKKDIPIIPAYIDSMWGSVFSLCKRKIKIGIVQRLPLFVRVSFGEPIKNIDPFAIRQKITELAAESQYKAKYRERTLYYNFLRFAKINPLKTILVDFEGKKMRAIEILTKSLMLSDFIKNKVKNDEYVGVMLPNCNGLAVFILAVMFSGKIPAILNYTVSEEMLKKSIEKAGITHIFTSSVFMKKLNFQLDNCLFVENLTSEISKYKVLTYFALIYLLPTKIFSNLFLPANFKDIYQTAVLLFTSGSSGLPKGVLLSHHNLNSNVINFYKMMACNKRKDKITGNLPLFHSFGINVCFWIPIMLGVKVVYLKNPLDAQSAVNAIKQHKLTLLMATPTFFNSYMRKSENNDLISLRLIILGAEKMRKISMEKLKAICNIIPIEGYGCTELSPVVSINVPESIENLGKLSEHLESIGVGIPGISTKIVDINTFGEVNCGEDGLLMVKSASIMKGYLNDDEKTKSVLIDGWYNTGDIAKMQEDGYLQITGRLSRFSKIGGEMVSHQVIEQAIHEFLKDDEITFVVFGVPDPIKGERIVVLYTKLSKTPEEIIKYLQENNIPNLWIPKFSSFKKVENIPLLGSGKIDVLKLKVIIDILKVC